MQYLVRLFPEIIIKSKPVRAEMTRQLAGNLKKIFARYNCKVSVQTQWDNLRINFADESLEEQVIDILLHTPGISNFTRIQEYVFTDMHDIYEKTAASWGNRLAGKTFVVRCKRVGKHEFSSTDVSQYVGGGLNQNFDSAGVSLKHADQTIRIEVRNDKLFVIEDRHEGIGGFPLGSQDAVMSLISGGFDSAVSSYMTMARGMKTHYLFFNLGGSDHELGVKEVAYYLWDKYGSSHKVKFITINFEEVVEEILSKVSNSQMGVILKRMFMRAASEAARIHKVEALVTGEAIAQVSSQTLTNLSIIDKVTDTLVLRPLITSNKGHIIDIARKIGTEDFSASIPEYCGVISVKPTTHARQHKIDEEESKFDFAVLERAIQNSKVSSIEKLADKKRNLEKDGPAVELLAELASNSIVVDIRHPDEEEISPLQINNKILKIPFYKLHKESKNLDPEQHYLLYCAKGVMSHLHAQHLRDAGVNNIDVFRPELEPKT